MAIKALVSKKRFKKRALLLIFNENDFLAEHLLSTSLPGKDSDELLPIRPYFVSGKAVAVSCAYVYRQKGLVILCRYSL